MVRQTGTGRSTHDEYGPLRRRVAALEVENARLLEEAERHRGLFAAMNEGFLLHEVVWDDAGRPHDMRYLAVNDALAALFGLTPAQMIGRTVRELFSPVSTW